MGIDLHNLRLLAHAQDRGVSFERSVGIGRQALFVDPPELERHRALRGLPPLREPTQPAGSPRYFEPLMQQWLGARTVDSVDASAYEQATLLHDMNLPWAVGQPGLGSYDAVLDFGCLEHVFDFPVAWRNCVALCRVGGHLFHSLPANNLSGHGFYQFSPELFFNLYQAKNGFELLGIWFAMKADPRYWWKVADPAAVRHRVTLRNAHEVYMLVRREEARRGRPAAAAAAIGLCAERVAEGRPDRVEPGDRSGVGPGAGGARPARCRAPGPRAAARRARERPGAACAGLPAGRRRRAAAPQGMRP